MDRREFLTNVGLGTAALLVEASRQRPDVGARELYSGPRSSPIREFRLTAAPVDLDLGTGRAFRIFGYNGSLPGPEIRAREGETIRVVVDSRLPEETTIHWHGLPVPNAMDGVEGITQQPIAPGKSFIYEFPAWPAGTYLYHSHVGYQLDQGLHGPLVIESSDDVGSDREFVLLLEDWAVVDGGGPAAARAGRVHTTGMMCGTMRGGMMGRGMAMGRGSHRESEPLQQPAYDAYTIN